MLLVFAATHLTSAPLVVPRVYERVLMESLLNYERVLFGISDEYERIMMESLVSYERVLLESLSYEGVLMDL